MTIRPSGTDLRKTKKYKSQSAATSLFDVRRWAFDVRCSVLFIFLISFVIAKNTSAESWYTVKWVNDGDTIVLTNGKRVRYIGINAPEIDHDNHRAQPFGYESRSYNKGVVLKRKIRLEFDRERLDRYGRLLAYLFLPDGTFLNEALLQKGYAYFLFKKPNLKYNQRLLNISVIEIPGAFIKRDAPVQNKSSVATGPNFPLNGKRSRPDMRRQADVSGSSGATRKKIEGFRNLGIEELPGPKKIKGSWKYPRDFCGSLNS
jgi:endonuclease YncB( thermonuclease family)